MIDKNGFETIKCSRDGGAEWTYSWDATQINRRLKITSSDGKEFITPSFNGDTDKEVVIHFSNGEKYSIIFPKWVFWRTLPYTAGYMSASHLKNASSIIWFIFGTLYTTPYNTGSVIKGDAIIVNGWKYKVIKIWEDGNYTRGQLACIQKDSKYAD